VVGVVVARGDGDARRGRQHHARLTVAGVVAIRCFRAPRLGERGQQVNGVVAVAGGSPHVGVRGQVALCSLAVFIHLLLLSLEELVGVFCAE